MVHTWLAFIHEPNDGVAHMSYPDERDANLDWAHYDTTGDQYCIYEYDYTLEFDAQGQLLGGEWVQAPLGQPVANNPGFLWRTDGELTDLTGGGTPAVVKASLVKELLDCSLHPADISVSVQVGGQTQTVKAVRCNL